MSEEHEEISRKPPRQQDSQGPGCSFANLWLLFVIPAFAVAGFWLGSHYGILWGILAGAVGAIAAIIVAPPVIVVLFAVIHVGIKIEDYFKPFPPSARAVRDMPAVRWDEATESPTVVCRFDCRPLSRIKAVALFLLALAGAVLLSYFAIFLDCSTDVYGFQLTQTQGRLFFGVFAALSPIALAIFAWLVHFVFTYDRRVVLTNHSLTFPRSPCNPYLRGEIEIRLKSITNVSVRDFGGSSQMLRIEHQSGVVVIPSTMFHKGREFAELAWLLNQATRTEATAKPGCSERS